MRWNSPVPPSVSRLMACVSPRVKRALPCVRGMTPDLTGDRPDLVGGAAVGAALLDGDAPADDVLLELGDGALDLHDALGVGVLGDELRVRPRS